MSHRKRSCVRNSRPVSRPAKLNYTSDKVYTREKKYKKQQKLSRRGNR